MDMNPIFSDICKLGNLEDIKKFIQDNPDFDMEEAYAIIYEYDNVEGFKWFLDIKSDIDLNIDYDDFYNNEQVFYNICIDGNLKIAKYLFDIKNFSIDYEYIFCKTCEEGQYEIVKWLLEVKPDINITVQNNYPYKIVCENSNKGNNYLEIAKLLQNLYSNKYYN